MRKTLLKDVSIWGYAINASGPAVYFLYKTIRILARAKEELQALLMLCVMLHHPNPNSPQQVCYFYLPSLNGKPAELITVLNCDTDTIRIPVPEEDVELQSFFQRSITASETKRFGNEPTWRIFTSWPDLEADHQKHGVSPATMVMLLLSQNNKPLREHVAIA